MFHICFSYSFSFCYNYLKLSKLIVVKKGEEYVRLYDDERANQNPG